MKRSFGNSEGACHLDHLPFADLDTAFVQISGIAGGVWLFVIVNASLLIANVGSGMASQLGAARLLLAMGQDGAIPRSFFGAVHPKNHIPRNNVLLIGAICLIGSLTFSYQLGTELLNYGALFAFMGVNFSSAMLGWRSSKAHQWPWVALSLVGFIVCFFLWINLGTLARIVGTVWACSGIILYLVRRRKGPVHLESVQE